MQIHVHQADISDFETIYRLVNALEQAEFDRAAQRLLFETNVVSTSIGYFIASVDGAPVGMLSCHIQLLMHHGGRIGELQEMYVDENFRSLGIGKMLVDAVKRWAKTNDVLQLEVTSRRIRVDAHRFYERENFIFTHHKFTYLL